MHACLTKLLLSGFLLAAIAAANRAEAQQKPQILSLAGGELKLSVPATWARKQPQSTIIEAEYSVPASDGDKNDGRLTFMRAGGGIEANIDRWFGQFTQPDGASTKDRAKVSKVKVAGDNVHLVDISGTFKDQRGPATPAVERAKYRMLAAIVETNGGNYFIKLYGPERTMADAEKPFRSMIDSLEHK